MEITLPGSRGQNKAVETNGRGLNRRPQDCRSHSEPPSLKQGNFEKVFFCDINDELYMEGRQLVCVAEQVPANQDL